ncbi:UNVERIFIED_CONTAM: hypothetical protein RMT77_012167 [Armadillidium vulgare]
MPKKFQSENTKAVVARARKAEKAAAEKAEKEKAAEDALWKEDDKLICKKIQRKEEKEKKKQAELLKKKELKLLEEQEFSEANPNPKTAPQKVTAYQIQKQKENERLQSTKSQEIESVTETPIQENLNRLEVETISASGIDEAVAALSVNEGTPDRHPEKRMAAAFRAFEAERMPQLKKENPTMRRSQLKQILIKEWQKSPQNPLNQSIA